MHYRYFKCIGQNNQALIWCDSLIRVAPRMGYSTTYYSTTYFVLDRMKLLAKVGRWEDAYNQALGYVSLLDSIQAENSKGQIEELQTQYQVDTLMREKSAHRMKLFWATLCAIFADVDTFYLCIIFEVC